VANTQNQYEEDMDLESYKTAHDLHKFFAAWRYKILAFLATFNGALFYAYVNQEASFHKIIITIVGIVASAVLYFIDKRNFEIMQICLNTARSIEQNRKVESGIYSAIEGRPRRKFSYSYRFILTCLLLMFVILWLILLYTNVFVKQSG